VLVTADEHWSLHTSIGAHTALFGCRDLDGSEGEQERSRSLRLRIRSSCRCVRFDSL